MLHQDRLPRHHPVLLLLSPPCPAMRDAVKGEEVAVLCLYGVNLHWETILGNQTWLWKDRIMFKSGNS